MLVPHQGTPRLLRTTRGEQEATERLAAGLGGRGQAGAALQRGLGLGSISEGMEGAAEEEHRPGVVRRAPARGVEHRRGIARAADREQDLRQLGPSAVFTRVTRQHRPQRVDGQLEPPHRLQSARLLPAEGWVVSGLQRPRLFQLPQSRNGPGLG